jgi:putative hydrolase of the HAD superfamily
MLQAVIFDMDGVIADTEPMHTHAYLSVLKTFGIHVSEDHYRKTVTEEGKTIAKWFVELGGDPGDIDELYRRKDDIYFPLLRAEGSPRRGLLSLLSNLRKSSIPCALATSARRVNAELVLDCFNLRDYFTVVLALEDVTHVKPHPEVFLLALKRLTVHPHNAVALEDAPKGVRAAVNAGIPVVAVPTPWTQHCSFDGAALIVDSLEKLSVSRLSSLVKTLPGDSSLRSDLSSSKAKE